MRHGQGGVTSVTTLCGDVADGHGVGHAEDHGAQEGHRQAAQTAHHRGGVAVDDELGEDDGCPCSGRGARRMPARPANMTPIIQAYAEMRPDGRPGQRRQVGVVDHGAHGHTRAGAA